MFKLNLSFRCWSYLFIYIILPVTFYIEVVTYSLLPLQWVNQPDCQYPKCSKVLLVADPQIIGSEIQGQDFINFVAKWDSDRYIRRTFLQAFNYMQPEVVIFLGDMMDEGHISSNEQFFKDLKRFLNIFQFSNVMSDVPKIFLPGDNDIGGVEDIMLPHIVHRFNKVFNQSNGPFSLEFIEFYKINFMTYEIQEPNYIDLTNSDGTIRVALSHVPLLPNPTQFLHRVVKKIRPHLIFSGHVHLSSHFIASESDIWKRKYTSILPNDTEVKTYSIQPGLIHEIIVPTCSYRMGVKNMGFGAAFIDYENKLLYYTVLWLPRRFIQLSVYLAIIFFSSLFFFISMLARILRKITRLFFCIYFKHITSKYYHIL